jgi:hypothetical protein
MMNDEQKLQAFQAFERDLPQTYRERPSEWVAYRGGRTARLQ